MHGLRATTLIAAAAALAAYPDAASPLAKAPRARSGLLYRGTR